MRIPCQTLQDAHAMHISYSLSTQPNMSNSEDVRRAVTSTLVLNMPT